MSFQPSAFFQPQPKPNRQRFRRWKQLVYHLKAAPFLSPLEQSAWQRGYTDVPGWTRRRPVLVQAGATVAGCGFGLTLGSTWWERGLFGALVALGTFLAGLVALWLWHSLTAPLKQRKEAREYAQALEAHVRESTEWARRREIAEDFRRETMEYILGVPAEAERRTAPELDQHWRATVANVSAQLREHGANDDAQALVEIRTNLAVLDAKADGYGENEIDTGRTR